MPELRMAAMAAAFAAGILLDQHISFTGCLILVGLACAVACAVARGVPRSTILIMAAVCIIGGARHHVAQQISSTDISQFAGERVVFDGVVASDPDVRKDRVTLILKAQKLKLESGWAEVTGKVYANLYLSKEQDIPHLHYGDRARVSTYLYTPYEPTNPSRFSWKDYLARQNIHCCASIKKTDQIVMLSGRAGNPFVRGAMVAKDYVEKSILRIHPAQEASLIVGIVLGTYSYLPPDTFRGFSRTGTLHILAASGYNCYILLLLGTFILTPLRILPKWRGLVVTMMILLYLMMVGPKPSLLRASIMAILLLLAAPLQRVPNARNLFFAAALVVLAIRPTDLFDIGFQLSFLAVWALISVMPVIESILRTTGVSGGSAGRRVSLPMRLAAIAGGTVLSAAVGTIAITLLTAPVIAYYFNYVSLVSIPANMAMALGVPIVFADGLVSLAVAPIPVIGDCVGCVGAAVTRLMLAVVNYLGSLRYSSISVASPGALALLGYYIILAAALSYGRDQVAEG